MSRQKSSSGPRRKPRTDIYTMLLLLAFLAIIVSCIFFYLEVKDYGPSPWDIPSSMSAQVDIDDSLVPPMYFV